MKRQTRSKEVTILAYAQCRKPGCKRIGDHSRGLCEPCYKGTQQIVKDGVISWETLERKGRVQSKPISLKEWLLS